MSTIVITTLTSHQHNNYCDFVIILKVLWKQFEEWTLFCVCNTFGIGACYGKFFIWKENVISTDKASAVSDLVKGTIVNKHDIWNQICWKWR